MASAKGTARSRTTGCPSSGYPWIGHATRRSADATGRRPESLNTACPYGSAQNSKPWAYAFSISGNLARGVSQRHGAISHHGLPEDGQPVAILSKAKRGSVSQPSIPKTMLPPDEPKFNRMPVTPRWWGVGRFFREPGRAPLIYIRGSPNARSFTFAARRMPAHLHSACPYGRLVSAALGGRKKKNARREKTLLLPFPRVLHIKETLAGFDGGRSGSFVRGA